MQPYFFRPGEIAFSLLDGFHRVYEIEDVRAPAFPLGHGRRCYTHDGKLLSTDFARSLLTVEEAKQIGFLFDAEETVKNILLCEKWFKFKAPTLK